MEGGFCYLKPHLLSRKMGGVKGSLFTGLRPEQRLEKGLRRSKGELKPPPERQRKTRTSGDGQVQAERGEGRWNGGGTRGAHGEVVWDDKPGGTPGGEGAGGLIDL